MKGKINALFAILLALGAILAIVPIAHSQQIIPVGACSPSIAPYSAASSASIHFQWGVNGTPGSTFTVQILAYNISANDPMNAWSVGFYFNPTLLQVESVTNGSVLNAYPASEWITASGTINNNNGYVTDYAWALLGTRNVSAPLKWVDLLHVEFEVNPSLTISQILPIGKPQTMMSFTTTMGDPCQLQFLDTKGNDITPYGHITNGTITYTLPTPNPPTAESSESPASTVSLGTPQTFTALNTPAQYGWNGTQAVPIMNYQWENVSNGYVYSTAQSFSVTFPTPGTYEINLTVWASIADNAIYTYNESSSEIQTATVVAKPMHEVTFVESGLPLGAQWSVTFNGETQSSASNSIAFSIVNGVYSFFVTPPTGYSVSPSSGGITLNGTSVTEQITLIPRTTDWWAMFHHDLGHLGYSTSTAPTTNQTLWTYNTGAFLTGSSPAVAGGIVFIGSEYPGFSIYALEAATGALIWNYTTGAVDSSPAVAKGMVYVGSTDDNVYALNATTGALVWKYATGGEVESSPAVANGVLYVGSDDDNVYALNATTGALVWKYATGGAVDSSPAVANGVVYVGSGDDNVYALNATTGALVWKYTTGGFMQSSPAVAGGVVYVGSMDDKVYALDAATGALVWNYTTGGIVDSSPAVAGGVVYVGSWDCRIYALNATTGAFVWSYKTGSIVASSPAVAGGVVYVGSLDEAVYAFGPSPLSTPIVRQLTFVESGLPLGAQWSVTFNGETQSSASDAITFSVVNGVYPFSIKPPTGYSASPPSGSITVSGTNLTEDIMFTVNAVHDVAVTNFTSYHTVQGRGYNDSINVTAANYGGYTEVFSVMVYANATIIASQNVTLASGNSVTIPFAWSTIGFAYGNYTISANITLALGETNSWISPFTCGTVKVTIPGDINGILGSPNAQDLYIFGLNWGLSGSHIINPNADLNGDGVVDSGDLYILGLNWGLSV